MDLVTEVLSQAKKFFALPTEKKMEVSTNLLPDEYVGYHAMGQHNPNGYKYRDLYEAFNWGYDPAKDPEYPDPSLPENALWPKDMPEFKAKLKAYQTEMIGFARRMTRMFALALHLPENAFDDYVRRPEASLRILHYPKQERSRDEQNSIGAHSDVEAFTCVVADGEGLEVFSKSSGRWIKAEPVKGAFVLNIADCFMRQTNDFFVSTIHRVINETGRERYSVPFFFGFNRSTLLKIVPTCLSEDNPAKYPVMTAAEYYRWRARRQKLSLAEKDN